MHGQFVWYELMTSNAAGARGFYPAVAGWGTEDWPHSQYTMWTSGGIPLGGIVQLRQDQMQQGMRSAWMPYIEAGDVDETARKAGSIGGRVLFGPQDIPGTGRFAVIADPQGAVFAIYHSLSPSEGFDGDPIPGRFAWHELTTTDYRGALEFYRRLFGWEDTGSFDMEVGPYQMYGMKGKSFGGMFNRTPEMGNMPPFWLCYIAVPDLVKAVAAAKKNGGKVLSGPMEVPGGGWIAVLNDPQGAMFALFKPEPEEAAPQRTSRKSAGRGSPRKTAARKPAKSKKKTTARKSTARKSTARKAAPKKKQGKKPAKKPTRKKTAPKKRSSARKSSGGRKKRR